MKTLIIGTILGLLAISVTYVISEDGLDGSKRSQPSSSSSSSSDDAALGGVK